MGKYYDVNQILAQGTRISMAPFSRPPVDPNKVLVGIILYNSKISIDALAVDVTDPKEYDYYCKEKNFPETIRVELYRLTKDKASGIDFAPDVKILDCTTLGVPVQQGRPYARKE
jgi:hypothetical protein